MGYVVKEGKYSAAISFPFLVEIEEGYLYVPTLYLLFRNLSYSIAVSNCTARTHS